MRFHPRLATAVVAVLALAVPAFAGDEAKPKASPPTWGAEDIVLREKTMPKDIAKDWTLVTDEAATAAGKAMVDAVKALVTKEGIDDLDTAFEHATVSDSCGTSIRNFCTSSLLPSNATPAGAGFTPAPAAGSREIPYGRAAKPARGGLRAPGPGAGRCRARGRCRGPAAW